MRQTEAIDAIAGAAMADGLVEAALLKGSFGRGDEDAFSDVDLYLVASPAARETVLARRRAYLAAFDEPVFLEEVSFGLPQLVAIFDDATHVDLYVALREEIGHEDPIRVWSDPSGLFEGFAWERAAVSDETLARLFSSALYCIVEADSAYRRDNYAWAAKILCDAAGSAAVLLRWPDDPTHAFLGLKKLNQIVSPERYRLLEGIYAHLSGPELPRAAKLLTQALGAFLAEAGPSLRAQLDLRFWEWVRSGLGTTLFPAGR